MFQSQACASVCERARACACECECVRVCASACECMRVLCASVACERGVRALCASVGECVRLVGAHGTAQVPVCWHPGSVVWGSLTSLSVTVTSPVRYSDAGFMSCPFPRRVCGWTDQQRRELATPRLPLNKTEELSLLHSMSTGCPLSIAAFDASVQHDSWQSHSPSSHQSAPRVT